MGVRAVTRVAICADSHGDQIDRKTEAAFFDFVKDFKPTIRIHLGDAFDLRWLRGKATEGERREKVTDDINAGLDFLKRYKPTHFITGNHDFRLWKGAACDDGKLAEFCAWLIQDIKEALGDARIYPYGKREGVMEIGGHRGLHGYHSGVYAARQMALAYGPSFMGHVHRSDSQSVGTFHRSTGHCCGALSKVDLEYNASQPNTLAQNNGWMGGTMQHNWLSLFHVVRQGDSFTAPTEFKTYGAKGH